MEAEGRATEMVSGSNPSSPGCINIKSISIRGGGNVVTWETCMYVDGSKGKFKCAIKKKTNLWQRASGATVMMSAEGSPPWCGNVGVGERGTRRE